MKSREPDVVVIGGGPAGTTVASLLKKYRPSTDVVLVERDVYPRHHIGESLVADVNRLLYDIGVYDTIANAGFLKKFGSTFIWGRDREPWSIEFGKLAEIPGYATGGGYQTSYTWHVPRHAYDTILLEHARKLGVRVLSPMSAEIQLDGSRQNGVRLSDGTELRPRFVVDATGQSAQLTTRVATRTWDPELRNVAVYGYYQGAELDARLSGTWDDTRIAVVSVAEGWIWYIPLSRGLVSVGVVTSREAFSASGLSLAAFLDRSIAGSVELAPLLSRAHRIRYAGAHSDVLLIKDYCYSVAPLHGPGWAVCGDAAGFVDPILSIGCYLSHTSGQWLAYALHTILDGDPIDPELCFRAYEEQVQFQLAAFRRMTYVFYGFNDAKETWWWEAKRILRDRALPASVDRKSAFLALATGYGINRPIYQEAISDFGVNIFDDFYKHLVDEGTIRQESIRQAGKRRFRRLLRHQSEPWVVPLEGTGKMRAVERVTFSRDDGGEPPSRLLLPPSFVRFFERLEGRTVGEAMADLPAGDAATLAPRLDSFLTGLVHLGVLGEVT